MSLIKALIILCLSMASYTKAAAATSNKSKTVSKDTAKEKKLTIGIGYEVTGDLLKEQDSRKFDHQFSLGATYKYAPTLLFMAGIDAGYYSIGNEVIIEDGQLFEVGAIGAGLSWSATKTPGSINDFSLSMDFSLPQDNTSTYEGYRGLAGVAGLMTSKFASGWILKNDVRLKGIINTYEYSPSTGVSNPLGSVAYAISLAHQLFTPAFSVRIGAGVKLSQRLNGVNTLTALNSIGCSYLLGPISADLTYRNGTYQDEPVTTLWFIDRYRQMVTFSLGYEY